MKRRKFFKSAVIGSAAAFVGYPLLKAEASPGLASSKMFFVPILSWSNTEVQSPYVDSNLYIDSNYFSQPGVGVGPVNAYSTGSGQIIGSIPTGYDVTISQIGSEYPWPAGASATLRVYQNGNYPGGPVSNNPTNILYDNTTTVYVNGVIDSFTFTSNGNGIIIVCFTSV